MFGRRPHGAPLAPHALIPPLATPLCPSFLLLRHCLLPQVHTCDGKPVLRDFDALRKRYATVFRESGVALRGGWRRRFRFEPPSGGHSGLPTFCLDFERHSSLVTPRPGLALDGSMGVTEPREQVRCAAEAACDVVCERASPGPSGRGRAFSTMEMPSGPWWFDLCDLGTEGGSTRQARARHPSPASSTRCDSEEKQSHGRPSPPARPTHRLPARRHPARALALVHLSPARIRDVLAQPLLGRHCPHRFAKSGADRLLSRSSRVYPAVEQHLGLGSSLRGGGGRDITPVDRSRQGRARRSSLLARGGRSLRHLLALQGPSGERG
eukprot:scaffold2779_cov114-Isochrysis_galbana.AAC.1